MNIREAESRLTQAMEAATGYYDLICMAEACGRDPAPLRRLATEAVNRRFTKDMVDALCGASNTEMKSKKGNIEMSESTESRPPHLTRGFVIFSTVFFTLVLSCWWTILKLCSVIAWSWWWVLSPLWIGAGLTLSLFVGYILLASVACLAMYLWNCRL